jgi:hypothetical protein
VLVTGMQLLVKRWIALSGTVWALNAGNTGDFGTAPVQQMRAQWTRP